MSAYKLVVVQPFDSYQRGYIIYDQAIVNAILDPKNKNHHNEQHVRKVPLSAADMASAYPAESQVTPEPQVESAPAEPANTTQADVDVDSDHELGI